ncbi:glycosyltransferase [Nonomuraea gerenzanensis]|uniref:Glycosyl transferase, group 1 n=1 Tax=Nonomuraea gerenzanensis TaxID=93944 RepID=A0A1M4DY09_9ACTN|nr:glycosyltransferase [Nonomuraea gerenzanensis]UBU13774.1 glycosyltransferase [Nonomuraea gerenzanensis]SBO91445.1 Glycosyl transferase, group 1 [Nonomuraea gerenzanensis]
MKVLVFPRDSNPYQDLLHAALRESGVSVRYLGELTFSHTLNLLLLPAELAFQRLTGARIVHLHWVWKFALPGGDRTRRPAQLWFAAVLGVMRLLGLRLVWTAHNVLPHRPVFADDAAARRTLVRHCDLVIAHHSTALDRLAELGAAPSRSAVIPHGPFPAPPLPPPGLPGRPRTFLFFGRIEPYKGVEDLLAAFMALPRRLYVRLVVAGSCPDAALAARLRAAAATDDRVELRLGRVRDEDVAEVFAEGDVVVLPFREITTSGSALLALAHGRPLIVPELPALAGLPAGALAGYRGGVPGLTAALRDAAGWDPAALARMSDAALEHVHGVGWPEIARATRNGYATVLREAVRGSGARPGERVRALFRDVLVRGTFLLLVNTVLLAAGGFVFFTLAARNYPVEAVGWLTAVTASVNLLSTVASLGLPTTLLRHLVGSGDPRRLAAIAVAAVGAIGGVLALLCLLILAPLLPGGPELIRQPGTMALITALVMVTAVGGTLDAGLLAVRGTAALLAKNVAGTLLKVGALLPLVPLGFTGLILAYGGGTLLACLLGGAALWPRLRRVAQRARPAELLRRYLPFSAAGYLATALGMLPSTVVPLEVLAIQGPQAAAYFAIAFQVAAFLNFIPSTCAQVLFAEAQRISLRRYLRRAVAGIYGLLVPAVAVIVAGAPYLLRVFGEGYAAQAAQPLRVLGLAALVGAGNYLVDTILISRDRTRAYVLMNGANAALVLGLVAALLPYGLTAAALGWTLAQGLSLLLGVGVLIASFASGRHARAGTEVSAAGR